jgi:hypothetical protein
MKNLIEKIVKFLFPWIFSEYDYHIKYLLNQRVDLFGQMGVLMERDWCEAPPTFEESIRIMKLYGATHDKQFNKLYIETPKTSILFPFFIDWPEAVHYVELDIYSKTLYVNGDKIYHFEGENAEIDESVNVGTILLN